MFSGKINFLKLCTYCAHHFYACFMCELSTESKDCLYILSQFLKKNYINVLDLQLFVSLRNMVFEYYGISFHPKRKPHSRSIFLYSWRMWKNFKYCRVSFAHKFVIVFDEWIQKWKAQRHSILVHGIFRQGIF